MVEILWNVTLFILRRVFSLTDLIEKDFGCDVVRICSDHLNLTREDLTKLGFTHGQGQISHRHLLMQPLCTT